ncbi:MAG: protein kinase [Planctomycetes bacterium]|nr:protein kinase [Planctomycetota bacterium]
MSAHDPNETGDSPKLSSVLGASESPTRTTESSVLTPDPGQAPTTTRVLPEIPGYEIIGELGRGGMGVVYQARHLRLNRTVALKMVRGAGAHDPRAVARFLIEAEAMAAIRHPHVVQVYESGEHDHSPYLVLEYLSGGALSERLTDGQRLQPLAAAKLLGQTARGIAAAHSLGIVHRDLKPGNILLDADGLPKVTDFGLAKRAASDLTATQAIMGTPAYMAPEQADGRTKFVGPAADVWSLGVILYECLVGTRPFVAPDAREILAKILTSEPTPFPRTLRELPQELELICRKCLEKEPADRYPTAEELADDLERFQAGKPISVRPIGLVTRTARWVRRNPVVASLVVFVVLTLLVVPPAAFLYQSRLTAAEKLADAESRATGEARHAEIEARRAETEARQAAATKDYFNLLARVQRRSAEPHSGWTWDGIRDIAKAGGYTDLAARDPVELRSAAAICLASPDLREVTSAAHGMPAGAIAYRPDGKLLAIAEAKSWVACRVQLVDPATGSTVRTLTYGAIPVLAQGGGLAQDGGRAMSFSPDGRWLVLGCRSGQLRRWDLSQDPPLEAGWNAHKKPITGVAFDPESKSLYTSSSDGTVKRWAVDGTGNVLAQVAAEGNATVGGLTVVPGDPPRLLIVRHGLESASLDTLTLMPEERIVGPDRFVSASATGRQFLTGGPTKLAVWDRQTRQLGRNFTDPDLDGEAHRGLVRGAISHDGSLAASTGESDGTLRLWDLSSGRIALQLFLGDTQSVAFSPDSSRLAVVANRKTIIYEVHRTPVCETLTQALRIRAFGVRPDGRIVTIATTLQSDDANKTRNLFLEWPVRGTTPRTLWEHYVFAFSSTYIVAPHTDGLVFTDGNGWIDWEKDGAFGSVGINFGAKQGDVYSFQADRAGRRLWLTYQDKLTVFDIPTRKSIAEMWNSLAGVTSGLAGLECVDTVKQWAVLGCRDGAVRLVRLNEDKQPARIELTSVWSGDDGAVSAIALNSDESLVAAGTHNGKVTIRSVPGGNVIAELDAHTNRVASVAFSKDGTLLATGGQDKRVCLWRRGPNGFELLVTLAPVGASAVKQVAFTPQGRLLVLRERESAVHSWNIEALRLHFAEMGIGW